ncbi:methylated-DNA-[protein]-cysteine S-methyltransferase [Succinivibrio dextrinosolvens]|uniref:methylated-DNA--[protein]-cysteine S-methyltransferase n=1 Tax=Succinivibrio dextrinosolvens TaxID=83771 RepID=UPI0008E623F2|nr:methylated-DNA--[protein]-cysteine S-methyltransferase [Succinivibrio dextrinosolvens]SFS39715.1 methylated-DNA-[protein]-cysteine S-methyltransferase [Succinivibrio dextrinosolvens]
MTTMHFADYYDSPLGTLTLASDGNSLIGLWIERQKNYADTLGDDFTVKDIPVFALTKKWLDLYFEGKCPDFIPEISLKGTDFQEKVWKELLRIPYGQTTTYGEIAKSLTVKQGLKHMSAQAVGGAVGHNHVSIIIPCHRVLGNGGKLTGYSGGLAIKKKLLQLEGINSFPEDR